MQQQQRAGKTQSGYYFDCKTDAKPPKLDFSDLYENARLFSTPLINCLKLLIMNQFEVVLAEYKSGQRDYDDLLNEVVTMDGLNAIISHATEAEPSELLAKVMRSISIQTVKSTISSKRVLSKKEQRVIIHILESIEDPLEKIKIG